MRIRGPADSGYLGHPPGVSEGRGGDGGGGESLLDQPDTRARGKNKREEEKREGERERLNLAEDLSR